MTIVNYFQTSEHRLEFARFGDADRRLSPREWLFGGFVGRAYVPLIDTAGMIATEDADQYRVLVPIANPRTESGLVDLACNLISDRENAVVHAVHIVQIPDRTSRGYGVEQKERIVTESEALLESVHERVDDYDIECETSTVLSHRSFQEIFDIAGREHADLVVMGWEDNRLWAAGRAERPLSEFTGQLPCDFLVLKDRGMDASRILLPTVGDEHCELSAEVARTLRSTVGSEITLLHVVDDPGQREAGERFLADWADDQGLGDAALTVDDSGNVEGAIAREADDHTLILIGATERGLLSRLVTNSLHLDIVNQVDRSVLLAERPTERSLRERLFGGR